MRTNTHPVGTKTQVLSPRTRKVTFGNTTEIRLATVLGEYAPFHIDDSSPGTRAANKHTTTRKRKLTEAPIMTHVEATEIQDFLDDLNDHKNAFATQAWKSTITTQTIATQAIPHDRARQTTQTSGPRALSRSCDKRWQHHAATPRNQYSSSTLQPKQPRKTSFFSHANSEGTYKKPSTPKRDLHSCTGPNSSRCPSWPQSSADILRGKRWKPSYRTDRRDHSSQLTTKTDFEASMTHSPSEITKELRSNTASS